MSKLKQEDHDIVRRALTSHERLTGERSAHLIDQIEVTSVEADNEEKARANQVEYDRQAELNRRVEETQQAQRRAATPPAPGSVQPGNPGPGQDAMATERAKAQGITRHGDEPSIAQPHR